jgi:isoleucyl-tRNA synthetase
VEQGNADLPRTDLLVWTTTPWTLPSNQFAAVRPDLEYALVSVEGEARKMLIASALVETIAAKAHKPVRVEKTLFGRDLVGRRYVPPFDYYYRTLGQAQGRLHDGATEYLAWRVVAAEFVTLDSGSGIVHQAPAFGEVDYDVLLEQQRRFLPAEGPDLINAVAPDGKFTAEAPDYQGRWVKDADKDIIRRMRSEGTLFHQEQYLHDYPFCWRAEDDPLIQYPRRSWFIRTSQFKDRMLANNAKINWLPSYIRDGRFGNFLETNVDWALSRERYWGTPLPIWVCEETGYTEAVASYQELLGKPGVTGTEVWELAKQADPELPDDLKVHKPYIDAVTYDSPQAPGKRMRRVSEVIDCWFDSGAMPFAQWGYPHQPGSAERFQTQFPADFISEAIDQTRGWFYSLLAISTLLFGEEQSPGDGDSATSTAGGPLRTAYPHPYRNCIVLGLMLGEDGNKMSKSKRNYREPREIFDRYGADALRWYFFANQPPWTSIRYSERAIKETIPEFLLRLWNVYSFLVIYANIDHFDPGADLPGEVGQLDFRTLAQAKGYRPIDQRNELDRWILSELGRTATAVTQRMDAYDNYAACGQLTEFLDALSNWYVRRSRDRFWSSDPSAEKTDAYWTLYECMLTTCKLVAPFVPFLAEAMWQNLAVEPFGARTIESVHLCDYPAGDAAVVDETLSQQMMQVREIVSLGRSARMEAKLKVRQPLARVEVVLADRTHQHWLEDHAALIAEELNVKQVDFIEEADQYITYNVLPDLKRLGPRLGKRLPSLRKILSRTDGGSLLAELQSQGQVVFQLDDGSVTLDAADLQVRLQAREGWAAAQGRGCVVVLSTELSDSLKQEGLARELVHAVQTLRKEKNCQYTDRIEIAIATDSQEVRAAVEAFGDYLRSETLATDIRFESLDGAQAAELDLGGHALKLAIKVTLVRSA